MKTIRTKYLSVELKDAGSKDKPVVLLLHGWPDDANTWDAIGDQLNKAGFRTIAPMHRGFGGTKFLSKDTPRTGNTGILALDAIDLMNSLGIEHFCVVGHDWGSNIAETLALGWPERIPQIAMLATPSRLGGLPTPTFQQAQRYWYHWFQTTKVGKEAIEKDPKGFARIMWDLWSPKGWFTEKTFNSVARSFNNPDWVEVTLHSYRSRWGEATPDIRSQALEEKVKKTKYSKTAALFFQGEQDNVTPPEGSENMATKYTGTFERILIKGAGHFLTRENPEIVAKKLIKFFSKV